MQKAMILREYKSTDAADLEDIIRMTWHYDKFCSPKLAKKMAKIYLLSCLGKQTFNQVAVQDGKTVGIIMGRDKRKKTTRRFHLRLALAEASMLCDKEGRRILKAFSSIDAVDEELLAVRGKDYVGELSFFAVNEARRGTGLGKALFRELLDYMKNQKINDFYLYTDSSCNYGFYEHQGMVRCGEKVYSVPINIENEMRFYLYEYNGGRE